MTQDSKFLVVVTDPDFSISRKLTANQANWQKSAAQTACFDFVIRDSLLFSEAVFLASLVVKHFKNRETIAWYFILLDILMFIPVFSLSRP